MYKVSQLIDHLQRLQVAYGNVPVAVCDGEEYVLLQACMVQMDEESNVVVLDITAFGDDEE